MSQRIRRVSLPALPRFAGRLSARTALRAGVIACAALALVLAIVTHGLSRSPGDAQRLVGHAAPQFALPAVQNGRMLPQPVAPLAPVAQQGHPTLLLFTYSLCSHCLSETQAVQQLQQRYAARGLHSVYIDSPAEATRIVAAYQQRLNLSAPVLLDAKGIVAERFGVHYYPAAVLLDAQVVVRHVESGEVSTQTLQQAIDQVMRG